MAIEKTINFTLEVLAPSDITVGIVPVTQSVRLGKVASYIVNLASVEGFAGAVDLTITGLPAVLSYATTLVAGGAAAVPVDIDTAGLSVQAYSLVLTVVGTEA